MTVSDKEKEKEKEKAKLMKEKAKLMKEKAKLMKDKAKAKLLKAKLLKAKLLKDKQIGGSSYAINMHNYHRYMELYNSSNKTRNKPVFEFYKEWANKALNKANENPTSHLSHLKVYSDYSKYEDTDKNIIDKLVSSDNNNKFEEFWDNITYLYDKQADLYKTQQGGLEFKIEERDYEEMRVTVAVDASYENRINSNVFHNCIILDVYLGIEICDDMRFPLDNICEHIINYINKLLEFKKNNYNDKYFLQDIGISCGDSGHRLKLIITPADEISIIDPGSTSLSNSGYSTLFNNLYKLYKKLEVTPLNNKSCIVFPQLDSALDIQYMLSVSEDRMGACTIISNLIVHVMVNMRITSKKAVNLISTTIVRKFIMNISIESFADGYLLFLYNIAFYKNPGNKPFINNEDVKTNITNFFKNDVGDLEMRGDSMVLRIYNNIRRNFAHPVNSPQRVPLEKLQTTSPMRTPTIKDPFLNIFKTIKLPWKKGTRFNLKKDLIHKTPIYDEKSGLMPFETYCNKFLVKSSETERPFVFTKKKRLTATDRDLLKKEIDGIEKHNEILLDFIYPKIGEVLIGKYGLPTLFDYFNNKRDSEVHLDTAFFQKSPERTIRMIGEEYVAFLKTILESYSTVSTTPRQTRSGLRYSTLSTTPRRQTNSLHYSS